MQEQEERAEIKHLSTATADIFPPSKRTTLTLIILAKASELKLFRTLAPGNEIFSAGQFYGFVLFLRPEGTIRSCSLTSCNITDPRILPSSPYIESIHLCVAKGCLPESHPVLTERFQEMEKPPLPFGSLLITLTVRNLCLISNLNLPCFIFQQWVLLLLFFAR